MARTYRVDTSRRRDIAEDMVEVVVSDQLDERQEAVFSNVRLQHSRVFSALLMYRSASNRWKGYNRR